MLSNIEKDVVQDNQLIAKEDFYDYAIMSKAIPGSGSLNFSIVIGKEINGKAGMFWVAFGNMAPAYVLMLIATILYQFIPDTGPFQIAMTWIRASASSAVLMSAITLSKHSINKNIEWLYVLIAFVLITFANISSPYIIIASAILTYLNLVRGERR